MLPDITSSKCQFLCIEYPTLSVYQMLVIDTMFLKVIQEKQSCQKISKVLIQYFDK